MNNKITQGSFVKVTSEHPRIKYMTTEFKQWLKDHKDNRFYVEKVNNNSYKLAKVHFMISEHFIEAY